jgi:hypothetical protein
MLHISVVGGLTAREEMRDIAQSSLITWRHTLDRLDLAYRYVHAAIQARWRILVQM